MSGIALDIRCVIHAFSQLSLSEQEMYTYLEQLEGFLRMMTDCLFLAELYL